MYRGKHVATHARGVLDRRSSTRQGRTMVHDTKKATWVGLLHASAVTLRENHKEAVRK